MSLPTYTNDEIADYLAYNWLDGASFNIGADQSLTVNITALTAEGQQLATWGLEAWTMVSGINFVPITGAAEITFDDDQLGAHATPDSYSGPGGTIFSSSVNVGAGWVAIYGTEIDSFSFQTYVHEIGHALGLQHAGDYDGGATYAEDGSGDNHYLNDSLQATIMSYFDTADNTWITADWPYGTNLLTPMVADILAIQSLYGVAGNLRTGDTAYGVGSTAGGYYDTELVADRVFTIIDDGGVDTINFSTETTAQTVDLRPESISSVGGLVGNMVIAKGTILENFFSGSGNDTLLGNTADNWIKGSDGDDILYGYAGSDTLEGGRDADTIDGGAGQDTLIGGAGADVVSDPLGDDSIYADAGHDRVLLYSGNNTVYGGSENDALFGGIHSDKLFGEAGNDIIRGDIGSGISGGADVIAGGADDDIMMGGVGADVFVFNPDDGFDVIASFDVADIAYDATTGYSVNPAGADFQVGVDHIQLEGFATVDSTDIMSFVANTAQGAVFSAEGTEITLYGVDAASLSVGDFLFL